MTRKLIKLTHSCLVLNQPMSKWNNFCVIKVNLYWIEDTVQHTMRKQKQHLFYILNLSITITLNAMHGYATNIVIQLPKNLSQLNNYICGSLNRKSLVCSECADGLGPSVTLLGYQCVNCSEIRY